jgi:hypothetical protein
MRYLDRLDLTDRTRFPAAPVETQFLKKDSLVLPGACIFQILFEGTKVQYLERVTQAQRDVDLEHEFY